ncbi:MAG: hypothetical protein V4658_12515 [Bacteroidota bacterium]
MRDNRFVAENRGGMLNKEQHRQLIRWACRCVEHVLPVLNIKLHEHLLHALFIANEWEKGNARTGEAMKASVAAHAVARGTADPVTAAIARAIGQAVATAHMADHALGGALYALKALKRAGLLTEAEKKWQKKQLPPEVKEFVWETFLVKEKSFKLE